MDDLVLHGGLLVVRVEERGVERTVFFIFDGGTFGEMLEVMLVEHVILTIKQFKLNYNM